MKLKKYRIVANPFGYVFFDGDALGKERYGYKNISNFFLLDEYRHSPGCFDTTIFGIDECVEVPDIEEMPTNTRPAFLSSNSTLLTAIGDKPSKITIEF